MAAVLTLDHAQIRQLLPQRHPILLLDRVLSVEPGGSIRAIKAISACEPCYAGLPDGLGGASYAYPVSLLIESFGQAAAVLWLLSGAGRGAAWHNGAGVAGAAASVSGEATTGEAAGGDVLLFAAARDCVIESPAYPGDVLCHTARIGRVLDGAALVEGETLAGDRRIAVMGSLIAAIRPAHTVRIPPGVQDDSK
jgi:3-hydroxyacyl-[acyl-carrier-protein] dehydratase